MRYYHPNHSVLAVQQHSYTTLHYTTLHHSTLVQMNLQKGRKLSKVQSCTVRLAVLTIIKDRSNERWILKRDTMASIPFYQIVQRVLFVHSPLGDGRHCLRLAMFLQNASLCDNPSQPEATPKEQWKWMPSWQRT